MTETATEEPVTVVEAKPEAATSRPDGIVSLVRPTLIFFASRIVVEIVAKGASLLPPKASVLDLLGSWDGAWYMQVAQHGYPSHLPIVAGKAAPVDIAFFPLFPLLIRAVHAVTPLSLPWSALVLSTLFGLTATIALWRLTARLIGRDVADRTAVLFCFFPGSIVFTMFYSEGLMLTLSILCLDALLRRRWLLAGILAGLATATRPNAVVLVICCAWAAFVAIRERREVRSLIAVVLAPLGAIAYFGYLWHRTGSLTSWFKVEDQGWHEKIDFGVNTYHRLYITLFHPWRDINYFVATAGLIFVLAAVPFVLKARLPAVLLIFAVGIILLGIGSKTLGLRPRFVLTAFPIFMALAMRLRPTVYQVVVGGSAALLGVGFVLVLRTLYIVP